MQKTSTNTMLIGAYKIKCQLIKEPINYTDNLIPVQ